MHGSSPQRPQNGITWLCVYVHPHTCKYNVMSAAFFRFVTVIDRQPVDMAFLQRSTPCSIQPHSAKRWGQIDRGTTLTRAGLHRCRRPRPRHAARLAADDVTVETYYYSQQSVLIGLRSRYSCSRDFFHWTLSLTHISVELCSVGSNDSVEELKQTNGRTDGHELLFAVSSPLARSVKKLYKQ